MSQGLKKYKKYKVQKHKVGVRWALALGGLTIHHVSFLHVPLGSSTFPTGSPWFRAPGVTYREG